MPRPTPSTEILHLFYSLDSQQDWHRQRSVLENWLGAWPGVEEVRLFDVTREDEGFSREDFAFAPHFPITLSAEGPVPPFFSEKSEWMAGALYYPLPFFRERSPGVLLIRTRHPTQLFQERRADLVLIASKVRDLLALDEAASYRSRPSEVFFAKLALGNQIRPNPTNRPLLESPNLPVYEADAAGHFLEFNEAFSRLCGCEDAAEANARPVPLFHPIDRSREVQEICEKGRVDGFLLSIHHVSGKILRVKDFAVWKDGRILGVLFDVTHDDEEKAQMREALRLQEHLNNSFLNATLTLEKTQTTSIRALARLAEYRDHETGGHLERISEYSRILTSELLRRQPYSFPITETYVQDLTLSSLLHDIGKVGVPDAILRKSGPLTEDERNLMRKHTEWGWEILNQADQELGQQSFLTMASQIALSHHERWDGGGYPHGLEGDKIPLSARIEAVADVYDALTSARPYKEAWPHERAVDEIVGQKGLQFDPVLTDLFWELREKFRAVKERFASLELSPEMKHNPSMKSPKPDAAFLGKNL